MLAALEAAAVGPRRDLVVTATAVTGSEVRAVFLRAFLLERIPQSKLPIGRFILDGASIFDADDRLDLSGIELKFLVRFTNCRFLGGIDLSDSKVIGFDLISGETSEIFADRLSASGSLLIRAPMPQEATGLPEPVGGAFVVSRRIRLCGAAIHGNLDLRGCWLTAQHDPQRVPLFADGLAVDGNVLLGNGFTAEGEVRLNGSQISRNLDCSGAALRSGRGYSLSAAGAVVKGTVYLTKKGPTEAQFSSIGTIRFDGAKIEGDLDMGGGLFTAAPLAPGRTVPNPEEDDWYVFRGDGLQVSGDVLFTKQCEVHGSVRLINARVGGDFVCEAAYFDFPGEETLVADGISVSGTTFVQERTVTNGIFRFVQATLRQGFRARQVIFDLTGAYRRRFDNLSLIAELYDIPRDRIALYQGLCGIYAPRADVTGTFLWHDIERLPPTGRGRYDFWLYLCGSTVDSVEDQEESWSKLNRFDVTACKYGSVAMPSNDFGWRLRQLDLQYAILNRVTRISNWSLAWTIMSRRAIRLDEAIRRFKPQPYIQLAKVVRDGGHEAAANDILVQLERNRTRYSNYSWLRQMARHTLDAVLRYGFAKFRPIWILLAWAIFSAFVFEAAYRDGMIKSSSIDSPRVRFNALIYAIDTLVPIVDLNQKKNWIVEPLSTQSRTARIGASLWCDRVGALCQFPDRGASLLVFFNTFFGWAMTTFFVAGISGLLRTGREGG